MSIKLLNIYKDIVCWINFKMTSPYYYININHVFKCSHKYILSINNIKVLSLYQKIFLYFSKAPIRYLKEFKNPCFTQKGKHPDSNEVVHYLRCLPYFFVAGFTKCGTTDFHARLTRHPLVGAGWTKEPHWWDDIYHKSKKYQMSWAYGIYHILSYHIK